MTSARIFPPTAQLAALVSIVPCVVFSHDKHLRRPGISPPDLDPVVGASIASSEAELVMAGAATATAVTGTALSSALGSAARALGVPKLATWSVLAVVVALGLSDEKRRRRISASLKPLGTGLLELLSASETAKAVLAEAAVAAPLLPPRSNVASPMFLFEQAGHFWFRKSALS